jgi:hypothetical protein
LGTSRVEVNLPRDIGATELDKVTQVEVNLPRDIGATELDKVTHLAGQPKLVSTIMLAV